MEPGKKDSVYAWPPPLVCGPSSTIQWWRDNPGPPLLTSLGHFSVLGWLLCFSLSYLCHRLFIMILNLLPPTISLGWSFLLQAWLWIDLIFIGSSKITTQVLPFKCFPSDPGEATKSIHGKVLWVKECYTVAQRVLSSG